MALDEQNEFAARIEDAMDTNVGQFPDDRKVQVRRQGTKTLTIAIRKSVSFTTSGATTHRHVMSTSDHARNRFITSDCHVYHFRESV